MYKKYKIAILAILVIVIISIIAFFHPTLRYTYANILLNREKFDEAISVFTELENYKDSSSKIKEANYLKAKNKIGSKEYEEAINLLHNVTDYSDSSDLLNEASYSFALQCLDKGEYSKAKELFTELGDYKDSREFITQSSYLEGLIYYDRGNFSSALTSLEGIAEYKDSSEYLEKATFLCKFQGKWKNDQGYGDYQIIFKGWEKWFVIDPNGSNTKVIKYPPYKLDDDKLSGVYQYYIDENGKLVEIDDGKKETYTFLSISTEIPKEKKEKPEPAIGMTANEILNSKWGEPKSKNKTTTAYGTSEQWVYSNYRYIYLDDGIVTAIQE